MPPALVILAAGAGARFGGLKPLAPIGPNGEALLEYSVHDALRAGFERVVLVVRAETEGLFRERFDPGMALRVPVAYVHQRLDDLPAGFDRSPDRRKPWGTGQAVLAAETEIDGPFAVANADDLYGAGSFARLAGFLDSAHRSTALATVGFRLAATLSDAGPVARALLEVDAAGRLRGIVELFEVRRHDHRILCRHPERHRQELTGDELVSMNLWGFTPALFPELRRRFADFLSRADRAVESEFLLPDVVRSLIRARTFRVEVLSGGDAWCGVTYAGDLAPVRAHLQELVAQGRYPARLWGS